MSITKTAGHAFVKYKGDYSFDELYKLIFNWLSVRRYEVHEKRYKIKEDTSLGQEIQIDIIADRRETSYTKLHFAITIRCWNFKEKEGILHGEKKTLTGGRVTIDIVGKNEFDWQNKFEGTPWKKTMGKFYFWVKKRELEILHIDYQEYEIMRLETEVKKLLKMEADSFAEMT